VPPWDSQPPRCRVPSAQKIPVARPRLIFTREKVSGHEKGFTRPPPGLPLDRRERDDATTHLICTVDAAPLQDFAGASNAARRATLPLPLEAET